MINVVTIDFWNTLFDSSGGESRNLARLEALRDAIASAGQSCDETVLDESYKAIWEYFDNHWLRHQRTPGSGEMVREICRRADLVLEDRLLDAVAAKFEWGVLDHPPRLLPGAGEALEYLSHHARLALISDTAFSPGTVLRQLMQQAGVAPYFTIYVFSDETGVAKPHPDAFRAALDPLGGSPATSVHIGDIERTDIRGAREAGMKAILYKGGEHRSKYAEEATVADAVLHHWDRIEEVMETLAEWSRIRSL